MAILQIASEIARLSEKGELLKDYYTPTKIWSYHEKHSVWWEVRLTLSLPYCLLEWTR